MKDTQEAKNTFPSAGLTLQEHLDLVGIDPDRFAILASVPEPVLKRALAGGHLIKQHAKAICRVLNKEHQFINQAGIEPEHIKDLNVWKPDEQHTKSNFDPDHVRTRS